MRKGSPNHEGAERPLVATPVHAIRCPWAVFGQAVSFTLVGAVIAFASCAPMVPGNLVLADGSRVNVVDHGDLGQVRADAAMLAEFLSVPLWDPA